MKPHPMLPDRNHDEQSRQDFVASLRSHLSARVMPGNAQLYESRLKPAFMEERAAYLERVLRAVQMELEEAVGEDMPRSEEDIIKHLS